MNDFALIDPPPTGVFLFEGHKIARASFLLPAQCRKVSTRAFLIFLEQKGWLASAVEVERKAILNGRNFSKLRFPS
jgi:cellulose biosynthesis protein BcsQ